MDGIIYLLQNQQNGKGYVGQTTCGLHKRLNEHRNTASRHKGTYLHKAIAKYGWDAFNVLILEENVDSTELDIREIYWISKLHTKAPVGYNLTDGGCSTRGCIVSEETRQKISTAKHGKKHLPHSLATRLKMSQSQKGRIVSKETKDKMRQNHADVFGSNNPMYNTSRKGHTLGNHHIESTKLKIADRTAKTYSIFDPTGNTITFKNLRQFCIDRNLTYNTMGLLKRKLISQHKGFHDLRKV